MMKATHAFAVGSLMYVIICIIPVIAYVMEFMCRYISNLERSFGRCGASYMILKGNKNYFSMLQE